jgi:hypothetical protein
MLDLTGIFLCGKKTKESLFPFDISYANFNSQKDHKNEVFL